MKSALHGMPPNRAIERARSASMRPTWLSIANAQSIISEARIARTGAA